MGKVIGETIHFKSIPDFYNKECLKNDKAKSNTVRTMDYLEYRDTIKYANLKYVAVHNSQSGYYFIRKLKDISFYDDRVIFSW